MNSRRPWIFIGVFTIGLSVAFCIQFYNRWQAYTKGNIVEVTITSLPENPHISSTIKYSYEGVEYRNGLKHHSTADLHVGDKLPMRHVEGSSTFLYLNEVQKMPGLMVPIVFFLIGVCCLYNASRRNPPPIRLGDRRMKL